MKYPSLVRPAFCKTPVEITVYGEGLSEDGAPNIVYQNISELYPDNKLFPSNALHGGAVYCNYQSKVKTIITAQKKAVQCNGVILISGDIALTVPEISGGNVKIFGVKRDIVQGIKARNPDGTMNFTELDVI